jgi:hypothetical protein
MNKRLFPITFILFFGIILSFAQVPKLITYQGYLDSLNNPYTGNRMMRFKIYDDATGGNNLWTEDQTTVAIFDGFFQVQLGGISPLNLDFDIPYWLGISIENEPELIPRTALTSTAYSINAGTVKGSADSSNSNILPSNGNVGIGTLNPTTPLEVNGNIETSGEVLLQGGSLTALGTLSQLGGLRVVIGSVAPDGSKLYGEGFTSTRTGTGIYQINFVAPVSFSSNPVVVITPGDQGTNDDNTANANYISTTGFRVATWDTGGSSNTPENSYFYFIAIGQ